MTVLGAFQGYGCVLLASDLKITFLEGGNDPKVFVMPKFHKIPNGDFLDLMVDSIQRNMRKLPAGA